MGANTASDGRREAMAQIAARQPRTFEAPGDGGSVSVAEEFGRLTLDLPKLRARLPSPVFEKLLACIERQEPLDQSIAAAVAHAAKEWAIENGATHFCHWFHPLTGLTAEKHDAFLTRDSHGGYVDTFAGSQLIQSEPDASSFPSGGIRTTFEARGYTAWDPASPMFLMKTRAGTTLCVPSAYMSYYGHALDEKTSLLRSLEAVDKGIKRLFAAAGYGDIVRCTATVGPEQEYFLVDRAFTPLRPDLLMAGRTVLGAPPAKGHELDDHYFGSISPRVSSFMSEFEHELYALGVPCKTRHNEVAPGQYETAPIFEEANVAADHNQLVMEMIKRVARRHEFDAFFHEKPFARINGSGKHLNWSMAVKFADGSVQNLFEPGQSPERNLRFLLMCAVALRAVHSHCGALRAAISGSGNDHRLGANEAPPAIISVFMGSTLTGIFDRLAQGLEAEGAAMERVLSLGIGHLPEIERDNTDRNRTSPFAFTGNKWEFRAVGGGQSISFPVTVLNAAFAQALGQVSSEIEQRTAAGADPDSAVLEILQTIARETQAIRFEGDNYSDAWVEEAERRGLPHLRKTSDALDFLSRAENHGFLVDAKVLTSEEVEARVHVRRERYISDIQIEVQSLKHMVDTAVIPSAAAYLSALSDSVARAKDAGIESPVLARARALAVQIATLEKAHAQLGETQADIDCAAAGESECARRYAYELCPAMDAVREAADALEGSVGDGYWPLPRYHEMLFVR